jgi:FkbM family methyltransferase
VLKKLVENHFFGRVRYQPFWERLQGLALKGMNCAADGSVDAGEIWVAKYVRHQLMDRAELVVFDVGANIGDYSLEVIQQLGDHVRLYAFEPARETFESLQERVRGERKIECLNFGFSDCEESTKLYSLAGQSGLSSVYDRFLFRQFSSNASDREGGGEDIELRKIDSFCAERNINLISLLKLDVEGNELKVLHGAQGMIRSGAIDFIQFEFGGANLDSKTFFRDFYFLLQPQYEIYRIVKDGLRPIAQYSERNEIFVYSNYLAVSRTHFDHVRANAIL